MKKNNLKEYRLKKGLTQYDAAKMLDITVTYVSLLERGERNPSFALLKKLAELYGTTIDQLFFEE